MSTSLCYNTIKIAIPVSDSLIFSYYAFHPFPTTHSNDTIILDLDDTGSQYLRSKNLLYSTTLSQVDIQIVNILLILTVCDGCGLTLDGSHTINGCLANYLNALQPTGT